jgi:hypothetical protein
MNYDYPTIEAEYMTSNVSINELARKHNVPKGTLQRHARVNGWVAKREQKQTDSVEKSIKAVDEWTERIRTVAMSKLEAAWNSLEPDDRQGLKYMTGATKDLKDLGFIHNSLDREEQIARIEKLRKDVETEDKDTTITVLIDDELKKFSK